jgi:hypothetical protein
MVPVKDTHRRGNTRASAGRTDAVRTAQDHARRGSPDRWLTPSRRWGLGVARLRLPRGSRSLGLARVLVIAAMASGIAADLIAYSGSWADHFGAPQGTAEASIAAGNATSHLLVAVLARLGIAVLAARTRAPRSRAWWGLLTVVVLFVVGSVASSVMPATNFPLPAALMLLVVSANAAAGVHGRSATVPGTPVAAAEGTARQEPHPRLGGPRRRDRACSGRTDLAAEAAATPPAPGAGAAARHRDARGGAARVGRGGSRPPARNPRR